MADTVRYHLPSNENLYVDLKARWSWGDSKAMEAARASAKTPEEGALAFAQQVLERTILGWNVKGPDGQDVAVSGKAIEDYLDADDAQKVIEKVVSLRTTAIAPVSDPNSSTV